MPAYKTCKKSSNTAADLGPILFDILVNFRLNHPVQTVRNRISELLCRIAEEYPQLVIYPAVVGSMSAASSETFSKLLSSNVNKLVNGVDGDGDGGFDEDGNPEMQSAYAKIVEAIAKKSTSDAIEQVRSETSRSNFL